MCGDWKTETIEKEEDWKFDVGEGFLILHSISRKYVCQEILE